MAGQMAGEWPNHLVWMLLGWVAQGRVVARKMGNSCGTCVVLLGGENSHVKCGSCEGIGSWSRP